MIGHEAKTSRLDDESETVVGLLQLVTVVRSAGTKLQTVDPERRQLRARQPAIRTEILPDSALILRECTTCQCVSAHNDIYVRYKGVRRVVARTSDLGLEPDLASRPQIADDAKT